ncbi:MAG: HD-GYP domain-containing protein [Planctomycetota bacterium]
MFAAHHSNLNEVLDFLRSRIPFPICLWESKNDPSLIDFLTEIQPSQELALLEDVRQSVLSQTKLIQGSQCITVAIEPNKSIGLRYLAEESLFLGFLFDPESKTDLMLVENALEVLQLHSQNSQAQIALQESAVQLAQSFEEQNWLRDFARNASFSSNNSINEVAFKILQPLVFLLHARDVYLIALREETEGTGLCSTNFGGSAVSPESIESLLESLNFGKNSAPLVRNNQNLIVAEGSIHSIVAVTVADSCHRGFLVAIDRTNKNNLTQTPIHDAEFGSVDVGLLEEAAVLLSTQIQNLRLLMQSNELFLGTLQAMSSTIDARDPYTQGHSERVARLSYDLAQILGLPNEACHEIFLSGVLHDIGKIGIPDDVLLKPGKLTDEEFEIIKQHPVIGHRIVERLGHLQFTLPGVLYHHERWDGKGYPHQLQGQSIPLMARIMAVADAFDAMTSSRPYRKAMPLEKAHAIINAGAGEQWDAEVVQCFNVWLETKYDATQKTDYPNSIIPIGAPMEHLAQAVTTLIN